MPSRNCSCGNRLEEERNWANYEYSYEEIDSIRNFLQNKTDIRPKVGIICGSGLASLADTIKNPIRIAFEDIPNFPKATAPGHKGNLIFGHISTVPVVCLQGRFHFYEGYSLSTCIMPVRLMKLLGASFLIASNAAGSINDNIKAGDIMLQKDHFNIMGLSGYNPLRGFNDPRWGSRFFSMVNAYDKELLLAAKNIAKDMDINENVHEGVYACVGGPTFETVVEGRAFRNFGVDAMGMSTVHEVTAARHCGMKCFAFSLITNSCALDYECAEEIDGEGVLIAAREKEELVQIFVKKIVEVMN